MKNNKIIETINKILLNVLLVFAVLVFMLAIYSLIQVRWIRKSYSHFAGFIALVEKTESMQKEIYPDELLIIRVGNYNIKEGDIISYYKGNEVITHRVIQVFDDGVITKGDNAENIDDKISNEMILGKIVFNVRATRFIKNVLFNPKVLILLIITLILLILTIKAWKDDWRKNE